MAAAVTALPISQISMKKKSLFVHHVYFWLNNPDSQADKDALMAGLELLREVPTISLSHIGTPAPTNRDVIDTSYAVSWMCFFETGLDQDTYQTHPIHLNFVDTCKHLWEKVIVYDSIGMTS